MSRAFPLVALGARAVISAKGGVESRGCFLGPLRPSRPDTGGADDPGCDRTLSRVSVLVNCAGIITVGPVEDQPVSAFTGAMESNYYSAVYSALAVIPEMLARGEGNIVNIASIGGKLAVPHLLPYTASKFALVGFSQGLHAELRSKGIRVTTVCPGLMRTGSHIQAQFTGEGSIDGSAWAPVSLWYPPAPNLPRGRYFAPLCPVRRKLQSPRRRLWRRDWLRPLPTAPQDLCHWSTT